MHTFISTDTSGGGKKGVAIRPYPSPVPPPFIPNAFYQSGTLTGSDSYWAVSRKKECESDNPSLESEGCSPNSLCWESEEAQQESNVVRHLHCDLSEIENTTKFRPFRILKISTPP